MKLAKKKENEKTRMDANMDLSNMRRKFHQVINTFLASTLTQNVAGPVGPAAPRIYW